MRERTHQPAAARTQQAEAQAAQNRPGLWAHIKAACRHNAGLGERVLWCAGVDLQRARGKFARFPGRFDRLFQLAICWEWWAVVQYRFAYWAHARHLPNLNDAPLLRWFFTLQQATLLRFVYLTGKIAEAISGARLNAEAEIGPGLLLMHSGSCGIAWGVRIGANFSMYQDANVASRRGSDFPTIGDNVTLFSGARVLGAVHVGDNVRVGANAVVLHDLPSDCLALGTPAQPVAPGARPAGYPASAQLQDLVHTLLDKGDLGEVAPGRYRDLRLGTEVQFNIADGENRAR